MVTHHLWYVVELPYWVSASWRFVKQLLSWHVGWTHNTARSSGPGQLLFTLKWLSRPGQTGLFPIKTWILTFSFNFFWKYSLAQSKIIIYWTSVENKHRSIKNFDHLRILGKFTLTQCKISNHWKKIGKNILIPWTTIIIIIFACRICICFEFNSPDQKCHTNSF